MSKFDETTARWILTKDCGIPHYGYGHNKSFDKVHNPLGNVKNIKFGTTNLGYCETCDWKVPAILFDAKCSCGMDNAPFNVHDYDDGMSNLLNEILEFEVAS